MSQKNVAAIGKDETNFQGKQLTTDPNFHSLNNLKFCKDEKLDAYIPDIQYRTRDPRFPAPNAGRCADQERFKDGVDGWQRPYAKSRLFTTVDFSFDADKQVYRCPQGKELACHARNQVYCYRIYDIYHARPEDCTFCLVKARCLKKAVTVCLNLSIQVESQSPNLMDEMKAKFDTEEGKRIYARRLGIDESVFADICVQKRMHRFTLGSKLKVDVQWTRTRFALVHNFGKIHTCGAIY